MTTRSKIQYRGENSFSGHLIRALFRLSITITVFIFPVLRLTGFIQVVFIICFSLFFFQSMKDCFNIYLRATKAPVLFRLCKDTVLLRYVFGRKLYVPYKEIIQITLDRSLEYLGWNALIETSSHRNILLDTRTLKNPLTLVETIRTKNHKCQIDNALLLQKLPNQAHPAHQNSRRAGKLAV